MNRCVTQKTTHDTKRLFIVNCNYHILYLYQRFLFWFINNYGIRLFYFMELNDVHI